MIFFAENLCFNNCQTSINVPNILIVVQYSFYRKVNVEQLKSYVFELGEK